METDTSASEAEVYVVIVIDGEEKARYRANNPKGVLEASTWRT